MFERKYTMVIANEQDDRTFRKFMTLISKRGEIKKLKEQKDMGWIILNIRTNPRRWQMLIGQLHRELNVTPYKINGYWFI